MSASLKSRHSSSSAAAREAVDPESAQVNIVEADNAYLEHLGYKP